MDEFEVFRRTVDEDAAPPEVREQARQALRARYSRSAAASPRHLGRVALLAAACVVFIAGWFAMSQPRSAQAWDVSPVTPPDSRLVAAVSGQCLGDPTQDTLVIDQRGEVAVALIGARQVQGSLRTCTLVHSDEGWRRTEGDSLPFGLAITAGSVDEELLAQPVDRAAIIRDGEDIEVSYQDSFYLLWWPDSLAIRDQTIRFFSDSGAQLLEVPLRQVQN